MTRNCINNDRKFTFYALFVFLLGSSFYFYEYFLQISPSVLTDNLMHDLRINAATLGTVSAFYYYTYTAFQIPAGLLCDRYGARIILTVMSLVCAAGALCFGISNNIVLVSIGRMLMGAGSSFAFVCALYLILRWFPISAFAFWAGITQLLGSLGAIGGAAPLAALNKRYGWHSSLLIMSAVGVVLSLLIFTFVRNHPKDAYIETKGSTKASMRKNLMKVVLTKQTWIIAIYSCLIWAPITAFAGLWGVPFLVTYYHTDTITAAHMISMIWFGIGLGSPGIGYLSEKFNVRSILLTTSAGIGLFSIVTLVYIPHIPLIVGYLLLFGIGLAAAGQALSFAVITDIHSINTSSTAIGFNNMAVVCGAILFQPLIGQLLDLSWDGMITNGIHTYNNWDFQVALFALPICYLICFITSLCFIKETHPKNPIHFN